MAKHFRWTVHDGRLVHERDHARTDAGARLDVHERDHPRTDAEARLDVHERDHARIDAEARLDVHERDHARIDAEVRLDVHERDHARTDAEARLDGIYVLRTSEPVRAAHQRASTCCAPASPYVLRTGEPIRAAHRRAHTCCAPASPYVLRTGEPAGRLSPEDTVRTCKGLADVERWFRTLKGLDVRVRPIRHREERRVGAHRLVCPPRASSTPSRPST